MTSSRRLGPLTIVAYLQERQRVGSPFVTVPPRILTRIDMLVLLSGAYHSAPPLVRQRSRDMTTTMPSSVEKSQISVARAAPARRSGAQQGACRVSAFARAA